MNKSACWEFGHLTNKRAGTLIQYARVCRPITSFILCISYGWTVGDLIAKSHLGCYQEGSKYVKQPE